MFFFGRIASGEWGAKPHHHSKCAVVLKIKISVCF